MPPSQCTYSRLSCQLPTLLFLPATSLYRCTLSSAINLSLGSQILSLWSFSDESGLFFSITQLTSPLLCPLPLPRAPYDLDFNIKRDYNSFLLQMLTLSLPAHRVEGSWRYRAVHIASPNMRPRRHPAPRFDPTKYIHYPTRHSQSPVVPSAALPLDSEVWPQPPIQALGLQAPSPIVTDGPDLKIRRPVTARPRLETAASTQDTGARDTSSPARPSFSARVGAQSARGSDRYHDLAQQFGSRPAARSLRLAQPSASLHGAWPTPPQTQKSSRLSASVKSAGGQQANKALFSYL